MSTALNSDYTKAPPEMQAYQNQVEFQKAAEVWKEKQERRASTMWYLHFKKHFSIKDIALIYKVTRQRVFQILKSHYKKQAKGGENE